MDTHPHSTNDRSVSKPAEALRQVAGLFKKITAHNVQVSGGSSNFEIKHQGRQMPGGLLEVKGKIIDGHAIQVLIKLVEVPENALFKVTPVFSHLSSMGDKVRLVPPADEEDQHVSLWVELKVKAAPMTMSRSNAFLAELKKINSTATHLQSELPEPLAANHLDKLFEGFENLDPVYPLNITFKKENQNMFTWAKETVGFLSASCSVAIESSSQLLSDFALSSLAVAGEGYGFTFGRLKDPDVNAKSLIELAQKAPARIAVSAVQVSQGTNRHDRRSDVPLALMSLSRLNKPMVFTGNHDELQAVFHGGQGGLNNPLIPVVRHIPDISIKTLVTYSVENAAGKVSGLSRSDKVRFSKKLLNTIRAADEPETKLIQTTGFLVNSWMNQNECSEDELLAFINMLESQTETLAGLSRRCRARRPALIQKKYTKVLSDPGLADYFKTHLYAQDRALDKFDLSLKSQLSKPENEPYCACLVGTAGTGKSESASLLAKRLDIPLVNIDAAGYSDAYTARAELRGSGRGLVGSDESGRLEQIAKHHTGVVLEISDLDHAPPQARTAFADQFLKILQNGEAESATGVTFSCASIVFLFTMNLPEGMDEKIRRGIGFTGAKSLKQIEKDFRENLKSIFSAAFLRRIGKPIVFEPLSGDSLSLIMEKTIKKAIAEMVKNFRISVDDIVIEKNTGRKIVNTIQSDIVTYGASAIIEQGRTMASQAMLRLMTPVTDFSGDKLVVSSNTSGDIIIKPEQ